MTHELQLISLHEFWFACGNKHPDEKSMKKWFVSSPKFDNELRNRFLPVVTAAAAGECREIFEHDTRAAAATIIALDQLPRNIFRGKPEAFASDALAQRCTVSLLDTRRAELWPAELMFTLMPLMHAENLEMQERCVREFKMLADAASAEQKQSLGNNVEYARQHRNIISQFGRFPYRNKILGRESTASELDWLTKENVDFGQKPV